MKPDPALPSASYRFPVDLFSVWYVRRMLREACAKYSPLTWTERRQGWFAIEFTITGNAASVQEAKKLIDQFYLNSQMDLPIV